MSKTCLFEWHRRFKEVREEVEDDHKSGRPCKSRTDENVERVRQKVRSDRRPTLRMIDELGMNRGVFRGGHGALPPPFGSPG